MTTWIFQGNPTRFDIEGYLATAKRVRWTVRQHRAEIATGDRVFFWVAGAGQKERAGIIAAGRIADSPALVPDDPAASPYWRAALPGDELRVNVDLDSCPGERARIRRQALVNDPNLGNLSILRQPSGTNFLLTDEQAIRLEALWLSGTEPSPPAGPAAPGMASQGRASYDRRHHDDPTARSAANLHAKALAVEHYRALGFEVEDTPAGHALDLRCWKGADEVRVKVGAAPCDCPTTIALQDLAKGTPPGDWRMDLFVAHGISLTAEADQIVATGAGSTILEGLGPGSERSRAAAPFQSLIEVAVASWRFARLFSHVLAKLDSVEGARYSNQRRYYAKHLEESLAAADISLVNLEGQCYDTGMPVSLINIEDFDPGDRDRLLVDQMVEPIIMGRDGLLRAGSIMVRKAER